jgi:hypothetical protein
MEKISEEEARRKHYEYMATKVVCGCGCKVLRSSLTAHRKTARHKEWFEQIEYVIKPLEEDIKMREMELNKMKNDLKYFKIYSYKK